MSMTFSTMRLLTTTTFVLALGFATAIDVAVEMVRNDLVNKIKTDMAEIGPFAEKAEPVAAESSS